jgi:hypothetical protein
VETFSSLAGRQDSRFVDMPESYLLRLRPYLQPGEVIEASVRSWGLTHFEGSNINVRGSSRGRQYGHAWLVISNMRLLMVSKGFMSFEVRTFQFRQLSSIEIQEGVMDDVLILSGIGVKERWVFRRKIRDLTKALSIVIQNRITHATDHPAASSETDPLKALKLRLAKGEINEEEFESLKRLLQA